MTISNIICIDDERPVLSNFVSDIESAADAFGDKYGTEINIEACLSGQECLDFVKECDRKGEDVSCIVTDIRMPGMTGDELLYKLLDTHPKAGKIIVTGFSDLEKTLDTVKQDLQLIRYLKKPYDPVTLRMSVAKALDFFYRDRSPVISEYGYTFKEVETAYELEQFFKLAYDVYTSEKIIAPDRLTEDENSKKQMYDDWDFRADTRHFMALKDGRAVGIVRINFNDIPVDNYMGSDDAVQLTGKHQVGKTKTEVSQLVIQREYRSIELLMGLFRFVYNMLSDAEDVYITSLERYDSFLSTLGATKIGEFYFDRLNNYYSVHHLYLPTFKDDPESLVANGLNLTLRKMLLQPLPR